MSSIKHANGSASRSGSLKHRKATPYLKNLCSLCSMFSNERSKNRTVYDNSSNVSEIKYGIDNEFTDEHRMQWACEQHKHANGSAWRSGSLKHRKDNEFTDHNSYRKIFLRQTLWAWGRVG